MRKLLAIGVALLIGMPSAHAAGNYIYSLSKRSQSSSILGVTGVPACVMVRGGNRRGLYIMSVSSGGNWRNMGLQPGDVLISVDNHIITDAAQADSELGGMQAGQKEVVLARPDDDGRPEFLTVKANVTPSFRASMPAASAGTSRSGGGSRESVSSLESYDLQLINADRAKAGASAVSMDGSLSRLAQWYAQYMLDHHIFAHVDDKGRSPQDRAKEHGITSGVYENLALRTCFGDDRTQVMGAHHAMMSEPEGPRNHRFNIMGAGRRSVGIGIARDSQHLVLVEEFTD